MDTFVTLLYTQDTEHIHRLLNTYFLKKQKQKNYFLQLYPWLTTENLSLCWRPVVLKLFFCIKTRKMWQHYVNDRTVCTASPMYKYYTVKAYGMALFSKSQQTSYFTFYNYWLIVWTQCDRYFYLQNITRIIIFLSNCWLNMQFPLLCLIGIII